MSKGIFYLTGVLSNESRGSCVSSLLRSGCNHRAKFQASDTRRWLQNQDKLKRQRNSFEGLSAQTRGLRVRLDERVSECVAGVSSMSRDRSILGG